MEKFKGVSDRLELKLLEAGSFTNGVVFQIIRYAGADMSIVPNMMPFMELMII